MYVLITDKMFETVFGMEFVEHIHLAVVVVGLAIGLPDSTIHLWDNYTHQ